MIISKNVVSKKRQNTLVGAHDRHVPHLPFVRSWFISQNFNTSYNTALKKWADV
jgi:hypothetical protein